MGRLVAKADQGRRKADDEKQRGSDRQLELRLAGPWRRPDRHRGLFLDPIEAFERRFDRGIARRRPGWRRLGQWHGFGIWRHVRELIAAIARRSNL
jgi:hypothetical protein